MPTSSSARRPVRSWRRCCELACRLPISSAAPLANRCHPQELTWCAEGGCLRDRGPVPRGAVVRQARWRRRLGCARPCGRRGRCAPARWPLPSCRRGRQPTDHIAEPLQALFGDRWPAEPLWIVAVQLDTGRRVVFGRAGEPSATVAEATQASCAIPAYFEPPTIGGMRYVDGGVHSTTNADVVAAEQPGPRADQRPDVGGTRGGAHRADACRCARSRGSHWPARWPACGAGASPSSPSSHRRRTSPRWAPTRSTRPSCPPSPARSTPRPSARLARTDVRDRLTALRPDVTRGFQRTGGFRPGRGRQTLGRDAVDRGAGRRTRIRTWLGCGRQLPSPTCRR